MTATHVTEASSSTCASTCNGSTSLLHLYGVTKVFLTDEVETHALSGIHLAIRMGEYVSIAGPSGCGKSTLLSILGLLDMPSGGSYSLKGTEVANLSFPERRPDRKINVLIGPTGSFVRPVQRLNSSASRSTSGSPLNSLAIVCHVQKLAAGRGHRAA